MLKQALILAGGLGTRLGTLTTEVPKPMLPVAGKPFLEYVIWNLRRQGLTDIVISAGYLANQIVNYFGNGTNFGVSIKYSMEDSPLGTGGAINYAVNMLNDTFVLINGDTLFDINLLDLNLLLTKNENALVGMALRQVVDIERFGEVRLNNQKVVGFGEKVGSGTGLINGGIYVMDKRIVDSIPPKKCSLEQDILPLLVAEGLVVGKEYSGFFLDMGIPDTYEDAQTMVPVWEKKRAVFLDRDGVINKDYGYVNSPGRFEWIEGVPEAIKYLNDQGYLVLVITNQAGIARGYYTEAEFKEFTAWINIQLEKYGAHIDQTYYCPHHPIYGQGAYQIDCRCRKPNPGMLEQALTEWNINIGNSFLIGDKVSDILSAENVGLRGELFSGDNLFNFIKLMLERININND